MAIISRCDLSELFEFVEAPLDEIALFVLPLAVIDESASV
jgi:hypothetical protein